MKCTIFGTLHHVKGLKPIPTKFYQSESGNEPVRKWLKSLQREDKKMIGEDIQTVQYGWPIGMPLVDSIEKDIWEVRSKIKDRIARVLFAVIDGKILLLHGFVKKTKAIPDSDKKLARKRLREVKGAKR